MAAAAAHFARPAKPAGAENSLSFRFCGSCGRVLDQIADTREQTEGRRWATVLFADVSGFTAASEKMDPEDVTAMMDR